MLKNSNSQSGQIIIIALVFVAIVISLVVSLVSYTLLQTRAHRQAVARVQGINIAEAGVEAALWKLNNQSGYTGETNTSYGAGTYSVLITNLSGSSKLVKVDSYIPNSSSPIAHRSLQITMVTGTKNIGFSYGVQVGEGGFVMNNNSGVTGNVYSDGDIIGASGTTISGDAIVAGATGQISSVNVGGNATAHTITGTTVGGNAYANTITGSSRVTGNASAVTLNSCTITGAAAYNTRTSCSVGGAATTPNPSPPIDPATQSLPIDNASISEWESDAATGGTIGSQTINGSATLGPVKINGDLVVNGVLTLSGTVWVTGSITIGNGATVKLASSYGSLSGELIAGVSGSATAGQINISNNAILQGSGTVGSYLLILSEMNSTTNTAIDVSNNATGAIIYAGTGVVDISNNAHVKEVTAYKIRLNNNATVIYDSGLASAEFTSGPSGGWETSGQTWQLLQ